MRSFESHKLLSCVPLLVSDTTGSETYPRACVILSRVTLQAPRLGLARDERLIGFFRERGTQKKKMDWTHRVITSQLPTRVSHVACRTALKNNFPRPTPLAASKVRRKPYTHIHAPEPTSTGLYTYDTATYVVVPARSYSFAQTCTPGKMIPLQLQVFCS